MKFCVIWRTSMDFKIAVFAAARDGNLNRLKVYLQSWRSAQELNMLVGAKTGGATPLVIACRNGHYDVAEYLIERCRADVEQAGSVTFDGETIEGAPPLWCAAAAGHLPLVRLLVRAGARVNSTTRTNSTPLRAACFDGHYDIVQYLIDSGADIEIANRHGHTCLMIACYRGHLRIVKYLLSQNADVNRKSVKGNTALHDCAESGSLHILKVLLDNGATMDVDSYGMTPLLAASVTGHQHIVEHLVSLEGAVTRQQRIDALELLGATCVDKRRDMIGALQLWKRAMDERFPADDISAIPKPGNVPLVEAYEFAVEVSNQESLDELLANPDAMRMQALLIRERILGPAHPDTSYYVRYRGAVYADAGRFSRCRQLWHHALDMQQAMLEPLSPMTQSSLYSFAELFTFILNERSKPPARNRVVPPVAFEDIIPVYEKAMVEIKRGLALIETKPTERVQMVGVLHKMLVIALHLALIMARLLDEEDCQEDVAKAIHQAVYNLVRMNIKVRSGRSVLHVTCSGDVARGLSTFGTGMVISSGPQVVAVPHSCPKSLIKLMLRVGADPNGQDAEGNTPLHLAARMIPCPADIVLELLNNGAHFDTVNYNCETFSDILKQSRQNVCDLVNPMKYTRLSCLAARAVKQFKLPYRNQIPCDLQRTVITH